MATNKSNVTHGRSIADMPKGEPLPAPSGAPKPPNSKLTLRQMVTDFDSKDYLIPFLKELATKRKKGPWRNYFEFFAANQSGDVASMSVETKTKCEKLVKELNDAYFDAQDL